MKPILLITGTSSGMGEALAQLAKNSFEIIGTSRHPRTSGVTGFRELELDLTSSESIHAFIQNLKVELDGRPLQAVIHNAGVVVPGTVLSTPVEQFAHQLQVNVLGVYDLTQKLLPLMSPRNGRILNIGSISARFTPPFQAMYSASKTSLACLTKAWRIELAPLGIQVSQLDFGNVNTGLISRALVQLEAALVDSEIFAPLFPKIRERALKRQAVAMSPNEAAHLILKVLRAKKLKASYLFGRDARRIHFFTKLPHQWLEKFVAHTMGVPLSSV